MSDEPFKVDKGIPIPSTGRNAALYPWDAMEVGDSFLIPTERRPKSFSTMLSKINDRKQPKRFAMRTVQGGLRVWRVEDVKPEPTNGAEQSAVSGEALGSKAGP